MDEWIKRMDEWKNGRMKKGTDEKMDVEMADWLDDWIKLMNGQINGQINERMSE